MLDVHKQRFAIRRRVNAGDLTLLRPDQEATQCRPRRLTDARRNGVRHAAQRAGHAARAAIAGDARDRGEQHAIGLIDKGTVVRLDPHQWGGLAGDVGRQAKPQAIGRGEIIGRIEARQVDIGRIQIAARTETVHVPSKAGRLRRITGFAQADDMPVGIAVGRSTGRTRIIIGTRVGGIDRSGGTRRIVGERAVHFAGRRIDRSPFGSVHPRRPKRIGGEPRIDQHVGLIRERIRRIGGGQRAGAEHQREPRAAAISVEFRDVERTGVEIFVANRQPVGDRRIRRRPRSGRDEFVDIFVLRIIAHVEGRADARDRATDLAAFMVHPAKRSALARGRCRIERIDFDDPAILERLVAEIAGPVGCCRRVHRDVPLRIVRAGRIGGDDGRPIVVAGAAFGNAVARKADIDLGGRTAARGDIAGRAAEVSGPILLGRQIRVPRHRAIGAIVDRAAARNASRREYRAQDRSSAHRAVEAHRRKRRDPAVERRGLDIGPSAAGLRHFDHRNAVALDFLQCFGLGPRATNRSLPGGVEIGRSDILMVECEHAARVARRIGRGAGRGEPEKGHAVMMIACPLREIRVGAVIREGRYPARDRIAQTVQHRDVIARRNGDDVGEALRHGGEAEDRRRHHDRGVGGDRAARIRGGRVAEGQRRAGRD